MCFDPISAVGFALSAGKAIVGFAAQQAASDAQTERYNQNVVNSLAAARDEQHQINVRQEQEQEASAQRARVQSVEAVKKAAEVSVSASGSGVSGLSVDALLADVRRTADENLATIETNNKNTALQLQAQKDATVNKAMSRINSMAPGTDPNPLGLALDIGGAGLNAYTDTQKRKG